MDLWVVAAAAGAGYAAKASYLKNLTSRITENSSKTLTCGVHDHSHPRHLLQQIHDRTCPLCRLAATERAESGDGSYYAGQRIKLYGIIKRNHLVDFSTETLPEFTAEVGSSQRLPKSRKLKKRSAGNILKPINFSESWLFAEPHVEERRSKDYADTIIQSPGSCSEIALTIGNIITRRSHDFRKDMEIETQAETFNSQGFSNNDLLIFFVGVVIGMVLVIAYNRREIDSLTEPLKKNEDSAYDLYEELEMKHHSTVRELHNYRKHENSLYKMQTAGSAEQELNETKAKKSQEISKVEAELEAELERLELTLKSSGLGRNFNVLQENFVPEKDDPQTDTLSNSDNETSRSSSDHTQTGMSAVSPQELSLRLHEVIQARLIAKIIDLEAALEKSQKRLQSLESDLIG